MRRRFPFALRAAALTVWPAWIVVVHTPESVTHSLIEESSATPPDSNNSPFAIGATGRTVLVWLLRTRSKRPDRESQIRIVRSFDEDSSLFPSGVIATQFTWPPCPFSVAWQTPDSTSQIFTVLSCEPDATHFPSGLIAALTAHPLCPVSFLSKTNSESPRFGFSAGLDAVGGWGCATSALGCSAGRQTDRSSSKAASPSSRKSTCLNRRMVS